ncbi:MAG: hypothetical protein U0359_18735 [Byssovorax sp.]
MLRGHGVLPMVELAAIFQSTMEQVILPGFEALGVDITKARAWLARAPRSPGPARA